MTRQDARHSRRYKGFERASGLLAQRIRAAGESRGFAVARLLTHWDEIAGADLARIAQPVKVGHGGHGLGATLTVLTNGANAPFVEMQKETLRARVNACYGYNAVSRILITQTAPRGFAEAQARLRGKPGESPEPPAPDPQAAALARDVAGGVRDDGLRAALEDMGRTILSRREAASPKPKEPTDAT